MIIKLRKGNTCGFKILNVVSKSFSRFIMILKSLSLEDMTSHQISQRISSSNIFNSQASLEIRTLTANHQVVVREQSLRQTNNFTHPRKLNPTPPNPHIPSMHSNTS